MAALQQPDALTGEQEARIPEFRDKWMAIGLSTTRGNHAAANAAILDAYDAAGDLARPTRIYWFPSPIHGAIAAAMLRNEAIVDAMNRVQPAFLARKAPKAFSYPVKRGTDAVQMLAAAFTYCYSSFGGFADAEWQQLVDGHGADPRQRPAFDALWDGKLAPKWSRFFEVVRTTLKDQLSAHCYGLHDAAWLAAYDFFGTVVGITEVEALRPLMRLARDCGWWWPFEQQVIATEKPSVLVRDEQGRLHGQDGPAVSYNGTWNVYAWHGQPVERTVIEDPVSYERVRDERNVETRRILLERLTPAEFVRQADATIADQDVDGAGQPRRLLCVSLGNDPERWLQMVEVQCPSTGHIHLLRVPPTVKTCHEAVAWTFGLRPEYYQPVKQQ